MRRLVFNQKLEYIKITPQLSFFKNFEIELSDFKSFKIDGLEHWYGNFDNLKFSETPQDFSEKQEDFILKLVSKLSKNNSLSFFKVKNQKNPIGQLLSKIPEDKKYKKLFFESFKNIYNLNKMAPYWNNGIYLIELGVNKDLVYNEIVKGLDNIDKDKVKLDSNKITLRKTQVRSFRKSHIKFLLSNYSHERVISLIFNTYTVAILESFIEDVIIEVKQSRIPKKVFKNMLPKKPKTIVEVHDYFFEQLALFKIDKEPDFPLNPREDFLKMDGKEIEIDNEKLKVHVPKTRKELGIYSAKHMFDNCVGTSDHYAQGVKNGNWTIIGVFDQSNKPRYCLQVQKYSFLQAKGVRNSEIDKKVLVKLESLLTIKPELPSQFIPVDHSFIFGYCYNPEKESLFIMFRKNESIYEYFGVSQDIYETFQKEKSKGRFLNSVLKKLSNERAS